MIDVRKMIFNVVNGYALNCVEVERRSPSKINATHTDLNNGTSGVGLQTYFDLIVFYL